MRGFITFAFLLKLTSTTFGQTSPHGDKLKIDCANCHTTDSWTTMARDMKFDHDLTPFKLTGQHREVGCKSCHESLVFSDTKADCNSCHKDVHQNSLGLGCDRCHTPATWVISDPVKMHQQTRFPLVGAHQDVDCTNCHTQYSELKFPPIDISCYSCHSRQYYAATEPNHVQAGYSTNCQICHGIIDGAWGISNFDHSVFPLVGGHNVADCFACHSQARSNGNYKGLSTSCNSCHQADFAVATFPNHSQLKFSSQCQTCHTNNGWTPATFDHSMTGFALTGAHAGPGVSCASCHESTTSVLSTDCYSCHAGDFNTANSPVDHPASGLPHSCADCHSTTTFTSSSFNHEATGYTLTGAHVTRPAKHAIKDRSQPHRPTAILATALILRQPQTRITLHKGFRMTARNATIRVTGLPPHLSTTHRQGFR